jgi:hypothetical protein
MYRLASSGLITPPCGRAAGTSLAPGQAPLPVVIALLDRRFEPQLDQLQHLSIDDPPCHRPHQVLMRNRVEILRQIGVHHIGVAAAE